MNGLKDRPAEPTARGTPATADDGPAGSVPRVLLVESHFVRRRTLAAVAADLNLATVDEAPTFESARVRLRAGDYAALVLGVTDIEAGTGFLAEVRSGSLGNRPALFAVVLLDAGTGDAFSHLVADGAGVTLGRPCKLTDIFRAIAERPRVH